MNKTQNTKFIVLASLIIILASGCSSLFPSQSSDQSMNQTEAYLAQTETALAQNQNQETPISSSPTAEQSATPTLTPTVTETPTPSEVQVSVGRDTNCRKGPGTPYDILGGLLVGENSVVVGQWLGGNYWIIQNPDGLGDCWLWGQYATLEGPIDSLPAMTQPPTPTFTPTPLVDWSGDWESMIGTRQRVVTINQSGDSITGTYMVSGTTPLNFSGTLSADHMTITGTYMVAGTTGPLKLYWVGPNQYNGNKDNGTEQWCGYLQGSGLSYPSPCLVP